MSIQEKTAEQMQEEFAKTVANTVAEKVAQIQTEAEVKSLKKTVSLENKVKSLKEEMIRKPLDVSQGTATAKGKSRINTIKTKRSKKATSININGNFKKIINKNTIINNHYHDCENFNNKENKSSASKNPIEIIFKTLKTLFIK